MNFDLERKFRRYMATLRLDAFIEAAYDVHRTVVARTLPHCDARVDAERYLVVLGELEQGKF